MKNPLVVAVLAGAFLIALAIIGGALLLRPSSPLVPTNPFSVGIPYESRSLEEAKVKQARIYLGILGNALSQYQLEVGQLPNDIVALHEIPADLEDKSAWVQKLDRPIASDPWGGSYKYSRTGKTFKIISNGPDGKPGTADDIEVKR
jgi:hypothetical protein